MLFGLEFRNRRGNGRLCKQTRAENLSGSKILTPAARMQQAIQIFQQSLAYRPGIVVAAHFLEIDEPYPANGIDKQVLWFKIIMAYAELFEPLAQLCHLIGQMQNE